MRWNSFNLASDSWSPSKSETSHWFALYFLPDVSRLDEHESGVALLN